MPDQNRMMNNLKPLCVESDMGTKTEQPIEYDARYPAWCPVCCNPQGKGFPFELTTTQVGCMECKRVWTKEELQAKVQQTDQREEKR